MNKSLNYMLASFAAALAFVAFCLLMAQHTGMNSDVLYPYSFARDIIENISVRKFALPAPPYFFPDITISLLITYFFRNPNVWFYLSALAQPFFMVWLTATTLYDKKNLSFLQRIMSSIYVMILIYLIGYFLLKHKFTMLADKSAVLGHHMFAAIVALALFLWTPPEKMKGRFLNFFIVPFLFFITSFSDLFFFLYFFALAFGRIIVLRQEVLSYRIWLGCMLLLFVSGIAGIAVNSYVNPNLFVQFHNSQPSAGLRQNITNTVNIVGIKSYIFLLLLPLAFYVYYSLKKIPLVARRNMQALIIGTILILIGITLAGFIQYQYSLRYFCIYYPIILWLVMNVLTNSVLNFLTKPIVSIAVILFVLFYAYFNLHNFNFIPVENKYKEILSCNEFQTYSDRTLVIATYAPAKVIFEQSNRRFALIQVGGDLKDIYYWMYNPQWASLYDAKKVLIAVDEVASEKLKQLLKLPSTKVLCDGKVLSVNIHLLNFIKLSNNK